MPSESAANYHYGHAEPAHTSQYIWPSVLRLVDELRERRGAERVFELGCGSGSFAATLAARGLDVVAVDPSTQGIAAAKNAFPGVRYAIGSSDDDLARIYGQFPIVVCLEVIEHVYEPRPFAKRVFQLLEPGGTAIISTPYHGYLKNLALAVTGKMDAHFTALWDYGHIKFWSERTLATLLSEAGFTPPDFYRVGRLAPFAKSMIAVAMRPSS